MSWVRKGRSGQALCQKETHSEERPYSRRKDQRHELTRREMG